MTKSQAGAGVLITGGTRGIGLATAIVMARRGWRVAVTGASERNIERAQCAFAAAGVSAFCFALPVEKEEAWEAGIDKAVSTIGPISALVCNAGVSIRRGDKKIPLIEAGADVWRQTFAINVEGVVFAFKAFAQRLVSAGEPGSLIAMSSIAGNVGVPFVSSYYAASKAALLGLVRITAHELGPAGIRVNAIAPGRIETEMVRAAGAELNNSLIQQIALGRLGRAEEVGELVEFLSSERASYITGACIDVTGGWYTS